MRFVGFATATEQLAKQASWISYGPTRKSSIKLISTHATSGVKMMPHMPTAPNNFKTAVLANAEFWADNGDELNEKAQPEDLVRLLTPSNEIKREKR